MAGVLIIIVLLLMLYLINRRPAPEEDCSPPEEEHIHQETNYIPPVFPSRKESTKWEKNYFINKHLHRDDEKHERHRRNQFPQ